MQFRLGCVIFLSVLGLTACQTNKVTPSRKSVTQVMQGFTAERKLKFCFGRTSEALSSMSGRAKVDLSALGIDDACLKNMQPWLHEQKTMVSLDLSNNKLSDESLVNLLLDIQDYPIARLNLRKNRLTDASISALGGYLRKNTALSSLNLSGNALGDRGACILATHLKQRSGLDDLNLEKTGIQAEGAACLLQPDASHTLPKELWLGSNHLAGLSNMDDNPLSDKSLHVLHLDNCNLDDKASYSLAALIKHFKVLKQLNTSDNSLSDDAIAAFSQAVLDHDQLSIWNMQYSIVTDRGEAQLQKLARLKPSITIQY